MFSSKLLCEFRNAIWRIRRAVKNDALEVGSRQRFFCGYYGSSLESLESILFDSGFVLNPVMQYEDPGQISSAHLYYDIVDGIAQRQHHIRVFRDGLRLMVYSHDEYCWSSHPVKHINGVSLINDCKYVSGLLGLEHE